MLNRLATIIVFYTKWYMGIGTFECSKCGSKVAVRNFWNHIEYFHKGEGGLV